MEQISKDMFKPIPHADKSAEYLARPQVTFLSDAWRRFKQNKLAMVALVVLVVIFVMCIIGPYLNNHEFSAMESVKKNTKPGSEFWFGSDNLGRDIFTRLWVAGRSSLIIGIVGALVTTIIGSLYGGISAYFGGRIDTIMMRIVEILISIPYLLIVILVSLFMQERSIVSMIIAMTITGWTGMARMVRGQLLALKNQEFVLAAQTLGVSPLKIITKHMIPNTLNIILVSISFDVPGFIFGEAFLSYLGIGLTPPDTSWGIMASSAQQNFMFYPYQLFFPSLMIALTMLSFTLLGDGLRDAFDPKMRS